jgi:hypothetical protein
MYVLKRDSDGFYVATPGSVHSYTSKLEHARTFTTREEAQQDACGNEHAVPVEELLSR